MSKTIFTTLLIVFCSLAAQPSTADHHEAVKGSISDLAWMTGSYAGAVGPQTLEENWIQATDGSIASLVRMTGEGKTSMIELIVVEQDGESLVLHIQQWDPGYTPRPQGAQKMKLAALGDKSVTFAATGAGGMKKLSYSKPTPDAFNIDIETGEGATFQLNLKAR